MAHSSRVSTLFIALILLSTTGCGGAFLAAPTPTPTPAPTSTPTLTPTPTLIPTPTPTPPPTFTAGEQARALAGTAVTGNAAWTPYIEKIDGVEMALVPAGCFPMGSTDEQIADAVKQIIQPGLDASFFADEKPQHTVCFTKPFWIDVYEVTTGQFAEFGGQAEWPSRWPEADRPRGFLDWEEVNAYCQKRGARLPTEAEWEYAARGPDGLVYPWGNTWDKTRTVWLDPEVASVGSRPGGVSWIGAQDMIGNASEWVSDWYSETYYGTLTDGAVSPQGADSGTMRVIRSNTLTVEGRGWMRTALRSAAEPVHSFTVNLGVRCAWSE